MFSYLIIPSSYYDMSFFSKLKEVFSSKQPPKYKQYSSTELKMIAVRTRLVLEKQQETLAAQIKEEDKKFKYAGQDPNHLYSIMQVLGQKIIEAESLKILMEMMRKVENSCVQIVKTNGDIALLKRQIQWFQCVLWYRQKKNRSDLQQLYEFCWNFFKGVDITTQLNPHCEVFQLYPILRQLPNKGPFYLPDFFQLMQPYVSCNIDQPTLDQIVNLNKSDLRRLGPGQQQGHSMIHPGNYPENRQSPNSGPKQQYDPNGSNPYISKQKWDQPQHTNYYSNIRPNHPQNYQPNPSSRIVEPNNSNTLNIPNNQYSDIRPQNNYSNIHPNNFNQRPNNYQGQPSPPNNQSYVNPNQLNNNFPQNNFNQSSNPSTNPSQQNENSKNDPQPSPYCPPKPSFLNTLLRHDSSSYRQRQPIERQPSEQFGNRVPFQAKKRQDLQQDDIDSTLKELDELEKKQSQRKNEEEKKRVEEKLKREEKERTRIEYLRKEEERRRLEENNRQEQERIRLEQEVRMKQEQERIRQEEERKKRQLEKERKRKQEQEEIKKQLKRREEQDERRKRQEEEERQRQFEARQRQRESHRLQREKQMQERQSFLELNVFRDMEREEIDRGASGRFSNNFGLRMSFNNNKEQDFVQTPYQKVDFLLSREKGERGDAVRKNPQQQTSLKIVMENEGCSPSQQFKLFYFKKTGQ